MFVLVRLVGQHVRCGLDDTDDSCPLQALLPYFRTLAGVPGWRTPYPVPRTPYPVPRTPYPVRGTVWPIPCLPVPSFRGLTVLVLYGVRGYEGTVAPRLAGAPDRTGTDYERESRRRRDNTTGRLQWAAQYCTLVLPYGSTPGSSYVGAAPYDALARLAADAA